MIIKKKNINFHARHSAKERTYNYLIRNSISQSVINMKREWHLIKNLDIGIMKKGAKKFLELMIFPHIDLQVVMPQTQSKQLKSLQ